jgi:hypothetical protein
MNFDGDQVAHFGQESSRIGPVRGMQPSAWSACGVSGCPRGPGRARRGLGSEALGEPARANGGCAQVPASSSKSIAGPRARSGSVAPEPGLHDDHGGCVLRIPGLDGREVGLESGTILPALPKGSRPRTAVRPGSRPEPTARTERKAYVLDVGRQKLCLGVAERVQGSFIRLKDRAAAAVEDPHWERAGRQPPSDLAE